MENTKNNKLVHACIYEVNHAGTKAVKGGLYVECMFNPYEYRVTKTNSYKQESKNNSDTTHGEFQSAGPQVLSLSLYFDTYGTGEDVSKITRELWKFMLVKAKKRKRQGEKNEPPQVAFEWGVFQFVAYITNMTQTFTLFSNPGVPVRAKVDITFTQYTDVNDYEKQIKIGGTTYERAWCVVAGDRLDTIAGEIYGDPGKWRLVAERNHILDPLAIRPGQVLQIPLE